jgi:cytochrome b6-f complex iron-sulfur subunit
MRLVMKTFIRTGSALIVVFLLGRLRDSNRSRYPRRTFVRNMLLGGVSLVGLQSVGGALAYAWPLKTGAFGTPIPVPDSSIPAVGDSPFRHQAGKFFLINTEEGLLALYWKCPHLGCTVPWIEAEDQFHCPCHSSLYNRHGVVVGGPAPRPMDLMAIEFDETGALIVNSGDIRERSGFSPEQATKRP